MCHRCVGLFELKVQQAQSSISPPT